MQEPHSAQRLSSSLEWERYHCPVYLFKLLYVSSHNQTLKYRRHTIRAPPEKLAKGLSIPA